MNYVLRTYKTNTTFDDIFNYRNPKKDIEISVVVPTYNESQVIEKLIRSISKTLEGKKFEIIVVDDSSPDSTSRVVQGLLNEFKQLVLLTRNKRGVFSAQQDGIKIAAGKYVVLMDADFSHPPAKILEMINHIDHNDIVSCSRFLPKSKIIAPFSRKYSTVLLNTVLRIIFGGWISDYSSIFLMVDRKKWNKLHFYYDSVWGEAGMEIFHQAKLNNLAVEEIPFTYNFREEGDSKSGNLLKYGYIYLKRAIDIKFFYKGNYGKKE